MTSSRYFTEEDTEKLEAAWMGMKEKTRKSYISAVRVFFDGGGCRPDKLTPEYVTAFFEDERKGSGRNLLLNGKLSDRYYRLVLIAAKRYIRTMYDAQKAGFLLQRFQKMPEPYSNKTEATEDTLAQYLAKIKEQDEGLFMACILALGAAVSPKELFLLKKGAFFERDGQLCLSVGMGTSHRYVYLPKATGRIWADYLSRLDPPEHTGIFGYDSIMQRNGEPTCRYNRILDDMKIYKYPGIDGKMTLQQFRTISLSIMANTADKQKVCGYTAIGPDYFYMVKNAYDGQQSPDSIVERAYMAEAENLPDTDLRRLKLRQDVPDNADVVSYPFL